MQLVEKSVVGENFVVLSPYAGTSVLQGTFEIINFANEKSPKLLSQKNEFIDWSLC